jgi:hypothetical protein
MTLFWLKQSHVEPENENNLRQTAEAPEYDEDGRKYMFRYPKTAVRHYDIDRERIFEYLATHRVPGERSRMIRRDLRNAGSLYEDIRDLETHPDVEIAEPRFRLRSA